MSTDITKLLPNLQKNVPLSEHTSFRIGGPAKYFYIARHEDDVLQAVRAAQKAELKFYIIGGGTNLLVSDEGFNGLVIKLKNDRWKIKGKTVRAESGTILAILSRKTIDAGLTGLEWAIGVPGRLGGALKNNSSAFRSSLGNSVKKVKVFDGHKTRWLNAKQCELAYKNSVFKKYPHWIALEVILELEKGNKKESLELIKKFTTDRLGAQPRGYPNAGCIFINAQSDGLLFLKEGALGKVEIPELYRQWRRLPAGWLIEQLGLKGRRIGGAMIDKKHANFIINYKNAAANDVRELIRLVKREVKKKFGLEMEREIQMVGFSGKKME